MPDETSETQDTVMDLAQQGGQASRSGDQEALKDVVAKMGEISDEGFRLR